MMLRGDMCIVAEQNRAVTQNALLVMRGKGWRHHFIWCILHGKMPWKIFMRMEMKIIKVLTCLGLLANRFRQK